MNTTGFLKENQLADSIKPDLKQVKLELKALQDIKKLFGEMHFCGFLCWIKWMKKHDCFLFFFIPTSSDKLDLISVWTESFSQLPHPLFPEVTVSLQEAPAQSGCVCLSRSRRRYSGSWWIQSLCAAPHTRRIFPTRRLQPAQPFTLTSVSEHAQ